jgi:hypothetical protein
MSSLFYSLLTGQFSWNPHICANPHGLLIS